MLTKFLAILGNTFLETIRQPIFGVLLWVAVGLLIINPSMAAYSLASGNDNKILKDVGLSTLLLYGLLASVFSATSVLTREIESFTVLTVISKPVPRPVFLLGKFAGVTTAVLFGSYLLGIVFLMTVRHGVMETASSKFDQPVLVFGLGALAVSLLAGAWGNYVYGWHFVSTLNSWAIPLGTAALLLALCFGPQWMPQSPFKDFGDGQIIYAVAMVFGAVMVLTALAVALATRFSQVVTLVFCGGAFLLFLLTDHLFGRNAGDAEIYKLLYAIVPNFQFFWAGDALTQEIPIPASQVGLALGYASLVSLALMCLGIALFETREVG